MSKIDVLALTASFEEIVGWPYVTPGWNTERGIDCSGAFVRAFNKAGKAIYHGSNRIIRKHCHNVKKIGSQSDLQIGMAVFKARTTLTKLPAEYKKGGINYDTAFPFDYYHIGLVVSINPLRIIHATPPKAKIDTVVGTWAYCGLLDEVEYQAQTALPTAIIDTSSGTGGTLNFRTKPDDKASRVVGMPTIPNGAKVQLMEAYNDVWAKIRYSGYVGYVMNKFIRSEN